MKKKQEKSYHPDNNSKVNVNYIEIEQIKIKLLVFFFFVRRIYVGNNK